MISQRPAKTSGDKDLLLIASSDLKHVPAIQNFSTAFSQSKSLLSEKSSVKHNQQSTQSN